MIPRFLAPKPLAQCAMEELAIAVPHKLEQRRGGLAFAPHTDSEEKMAARQLVLDLFTNDKWPQRRGLHMITMPSVQWRFERKLLGLRQPGWLRHPRSTGTFFTSFENDRAVYRAAVTQMPGLHTPEAMLRPIRSYPFAEIGVKTRFASFFFANIDDALTFENWAGGATAEWDAAWLDYTGPLTIERLNAIAAFYQKHIIRILIITALKTRWNASTMKAIKEAGGHSAWLRQHLTGEILHDIEYYDTSSMCQFAIEKRRWHSPLI